MFKPSKSNNNIINFSKTILQTIVFWLLFLYLIPKCILIFEEVYQIVEFQPSRIIGSVFFLFFSVVALYSAYTMSWIGKGTPLPLDCPKHLVVKGPYKYVRNPMAVTGIGQGVSVGIFLGSYLVIIYAVTGAILWHWVVRPIEEKDLEARFGKTYLDYKQKVKCWLPKLNLYDSDRV